MSWRMVITCRICGATEHRTYQDDEDPGKHTCRASTVGEGTVTL